MSGSGADTGYDYQANAIAYVAAHALVEQGLDWFDGCADVASSWSAETAGPGDDFSITTLSGDTIEIQAKHGLTRGTEYLDTFRKLLQGLHARPQLRVVLFVDRHASEIIRGDLKLDIERMGQGRSDNLKTITVDLLKELQEGPDPAIFSRCRIVVVDLDLGSDGNAVIVSLLSRIVPAARSKTAYELLGKRGHALIKSRGKDDALRCARYLDMAIGLIPSIPLSAVSLARFADFVRTTNSHFYSPALQRQFPVANAWAKICQIDKEQETQSILDRQNSLETELKRYQEWARLASSQRRERQIEAEFLADSQRHLVIIGGPGSGKTTLSRKLVYLASADHVAVRVRLPVVAARCREGATFEAALIEAMIESSSFTADEGRRIVNAAEYLIADGLDECDPSRADIAAALAKWAQSHPLAHICVLTRPVGHSPALLPGFTQARIGGNNPAETTGKFIAAKFEHDTARPVNGYAAPQLHTHAIVFNITEREDGSTRALQERPFFESKQFATAVYQSELMYRLRALGYEIETGKSGAPEIKGYSQEYLDASSLRAHQIKDEMERKGVSGPKAAQIAAHATREKKQTLTREQVLEAHRKVAFEYGGQPQKVVTEARERASTQQHNPDRILRAREAVTYARDSIFEREAVADERLIFRDALRRGMGETTYAEVHADFEARRERGDFRPVEAAKYASGRRFTTPETIAAERANVAYVLSGRNAVQPIMSAEHAQEQAKSHEFLNDSQRRVIEEVLNSTDRIHGLQGRAGTGKTTVLATIREGAEKSGYTVEGFAPTSRASAQLREAGIDAHTLQSFLARGENHPGADPQLHHLYMLDESSLASTRQMRAFLDKLRPDDRVLVIGDTSQHQGVDAGKPFEQMRDAGMRTSQLDQIMRQKDPELLKAVEHLARNNTQQGIDMLAGQGRISEIPDGLQRIVAIAKDYAAQPDNTIVVSPDNRSRRQINEAIRAELLRKGALAGNDQMFRTLAHRSDMTGADRTWAARYNIGDVLQYTTGSKAEGIARDSFATVRAVDTRANTLTVELANGSTVTYDPRRLRGVNIFREIEREFATGDRIQMTSPNKQLGVANRDLGAITKIEDNQMTVRMDGRKERTITFDPSAFRQFDHGYAVTSHSSQGLTAGRVLAHFDTEGPRSLINTRLAYVAVSRASDDVRIYTNDAESLGQRLATDISKTAAVNFRPSGSPTEVQQAIAAFRANDSAAGTAKLRNQGRVYEYASPEDRLRAVSLAYTAQEDRAVIVAPDGAERRKLTQFVRDELCQQGRLASESRAVPVLVERHFGNPRLAANYAPGDEIHYQAGSPTQHGIADNSTATVLSVDARANTLTVATRDGNEVSYNPALLKKQTGQSIIHREEKCDLAVGERIRFTLSDREAHIRSGNFATVERIGEGNVLSVRLDSGKSLKLDSDQVRHIEYGYAVESIPRVSLDRVLVTGDASQLREQRETLARLSPHIRDLALYTSGSRELTEKKAIPGAEVALPQAGISLSTDALSVPSTPEIEVTGFGIGL